MCEFGDQAEYDYIIEQGQLEAENFGENVLFRTSISWVPAKWLNPPHPVERLFIQRNAIGDVLFDSDPRSNS